LQPGENIKNVSTPYILLLFDVICMK